MPFRHYPALHAYLRGSRFASDGALNTEDCLALRADLEALLEADAEVMYGGDAWNTRAEFIRQIRHAACDLRRYMNDQLGVQSDFEFLEIA